MKLGVTKVSDLNEILHKDIINIDITVPSITLAPRDEKKRLSHDQGMRYFEVSDFCYTYVPVITNFNTAFE